MFLLEFVLYLGFVLERSLRFGLLGRFWVYMYMYHSVSGMAGHTGTITLISSCLFAECPRLQVYRDFVTVGIAEPFLRNSAWLVLTGTGKAITVRVDIYPLKERIPDLTAA